MNRKLLFIIAAISLFALTGLAFSNLSPTSGANPIGIECVNGGVVDKAPGESFTVRITFKNTGQTVGHWSVNIAFEGEEWSWSGTAQNLTLKPCHKKTLTWCGTVPEDAQVDSVARLIVYFNGEFVRLDWWIHVVEAAELSIVSSSVE